jgi:hypothetical protein
MDAVDEWADTVRDLKDAEKSEGTEPFDVERICRDILRYVRRVRIREVGRFHQRTGLEYEAFLKSLSTYDPELVLRIVGDDEFWEATIEMVRK